MALLVQIALQLVLPAVLLFDLFKKSYRQRRDWIVDLVLTGLILLFVFLIARWDWTSYYFRVLLFPAYGLVAYVSFRCIDRKKDGTFEPLTTKQYLTYGAKGLIIVVALIANVSAFRGYVAPDDTIDLSYPLRSGLYYVGGGGSNHWVNGHSLHPHQEYAIDIVQLNAFGNRARGLNPEQLERYTIFGDRVYSPCTGTILKSVDAYPDLPPPQRDEEHLAGNHVVIACRGVEVVLAHLKEGSVTVQEEEEVVEGQVIGQVGNSGNTSQPHLHIHAEREGASRGQILEGEAVPIRFAGRFLVRNSLFTGRKNVETESVEAASPIID